MTLYFGKPGIFLSCIFIYFLSKIYFFVAALTEGYPGIYHMRPRLFGSHLCLPSMAAGSPQAHPVASAG